MLVFLEHYDAGAFPHHETVAVLVIGTRGFFRRVVEGGRQRPRCAKPRHRQPTYRRFGSAGHHHIGVVERDQPACIADRVGAGRTRRDHRMVGTLEAVLDRYIAGSQIDQTPGNEERRYFARAALLEKQRRIGNAGQAADPRADHRARRATILFGSGMPIGVIERLARRAHRENDEIVDLALILRLHPLVRIERAAAAVTPWNHAGDPAGQIGYVKRVDLSGAALTVEDALPGRFDAAAEWRHHAEARDDNPPPFQHSSPGFAVHNKKPVDRWTTARPVSSAPRGGVSFSRSFPEILWRRQR